MPTRDSSHAAVLTPAQFAERFRESSRVLWCIAAGVLGERAQAEDVLQEAALTALSKLHTFRPESNFVAWIGQFVRYVALNHRRKRERRSRALRKEASSEPARDDQPPAAMFDANVRLALEALGETARTCLLLKTVVELDYAEISELLDIPVGTAMSHVSRARAKMQKLLGEPQWATQGGGSR
ncbi:RNA polymerase sigma factor [Paraliomyxa miuraensis]|uniref:RNA polymerase sigma factor n=1 Tax=Paraliomyxa miuraensis TaxID=376150 RepID=UPI00225854B2|nr:sigma-70 family RNA polymerase sigma factor [Paraliomyxa miuraensis]MCX4246543.1 sigma-70 family RNA polymerase sigma factor [Paraliomyxa miuraensis]